MAFSGDLSNMQATITVQKGAISTHCTGSGVESWLTLSRFEGLGARSTPRSTPNGSMGRTALRNTTEGREVLQLPKPRSRSRSDGHSAAEARSEVESEGLGLRRAKSHSGMRLDRLKLE